MIISHAWKDTLRKPERRFPNVPLSLPTGTNRFQHYNHIQGRVPARRQLYNARAARANRNKSREKLNLFGTSAELIQLRGGDGDGVWGGGVRLGSFLLEFDVFKAAQQPPIKALARLKREGKEHRVKKQTSWPISLERGIKNCCSQ